MQIPLIGGCQCGKLRYLQRRRRFGSRLILPRDDWDAHKGKDMSSPASL